MKQPARFVIKTAPFVAAILIVIEIIITNQLVGGGREVRSMDLSIDELRQANAMLEQKVASESSLMAISVRAAELGFIKPEKTQFLTLTPGELPVALANQ